MKKKPKPWKVVWTKYFESLEDERKVWEQKRQGLQIAGVWVEEVGIKRRKAAKDLILFNEK